MSNLHNIQKSLADRLNAEFDDQNGSSKQASDSSEPIEQPTENEQVVIGLAKHAEEKEQLKQAQEEATRSSSKRNDSNAPKPFVIGLGLLALAAIVFVGEGLV